MTERLCLCQLIWEIQYADIGYPECIEQLCVFNVSLKEPHFNINIQ